MKTNLNEMISLIANNDPKDIYNSLLESDEDFREFIERNKTMNTSQMIMRYGLDNIIREQVSHAS